MDNCYCIQLRKIAHKITNFYNEALKPTNLSISQYSLMDHLNQLKNPSVSELAEVLGLDRTTLVRTLKPLEKRELVADKKVFGQRNRQLFLTEKGKVLLEEAQYYWMLAQTAIEETLGDSGLEEINLIDKRLSEIKKQKNTKNLGE